MWGCQSYIVMNKNEIINNVFIGYIFILINWAALFNAPAVYVWLEFAHSAAGSRLLDWLYDCI